MSDPRFLQSGFDKQLAHFIEECGEALAAAGKTQRWGPHSSNPYLPKEQRELNIDWLWREMLDLRQAIDRFEQTLRQTFIPAHMASKWPLPLEQRSQAEIISLAVRDACELPGDDGRIPEEERLVMRVTDLRSIVHAAVLRAWPKP